MADETKNFNRQVKNNKARVAFRRYMALLENNGLRYKVFGV